MSDRKSENSETKRPARVQDKLNNRCLQPCMFELLAWPSSLRDTENLCSHCNILNSKCQNNMARSCQIASNQSGCQDHQAAEPENVSIFKDQYQQVNSPIKNNIRNPKQGNSFIHTHKKVLKPHQIHKQLYMYQKANLRMSSDDLMAAKHNKSVDSEIKAQKHKLDIRNEKDRAVIQKRQAKIKEFNRITRDLPNSAFTTYFGKPTFQSYGRCNSQHFQSHNVMPHRGSNHPSYKQTYNSALIKGKKLKINNYLPRKPVQNLKSYTKQIQNVQDVVNLPLQKPDLINHLRFSESQPKPDKKERTLYNSTVNIQKKKTAKHKTNKSTVLLNNKKQNKKNLKSTISFNDGLKYMNNRQNLLELLQAKKTRQSRLAYKVTECYPGTTQVSQTIETRGSQIKQSPPAGKKSIKGLSVKQIIHQRKLKL